ncbi:MAG: uroporphyrinogen-III C-methyltransferase, partial [Pseudomonadota bacterium]
SRAAPEIARRLIASGRAPATPLAIVSNAGRTDARLARSTLAETAAGAAPDTGGGPALILVGDVLALAAAAAAPLVGAA